jgi:hypothetical protein
MLLKPVTLVEERVEREGSTADDGAFSTDH